MPEEPSERLGRRVDPNTPAFPSRYFRDTVMEHGEVLHEQE